MFRKIALFFKLMWRGDERWRFYVLKGLGRLVFSKYRYTWFQLSWWHDKDFNRYLDRFNERRTPDTHRRWMLFQLYRLTANSDGDTAECGVYRGVSSYLICHLNQQLETKTRAHHIFDSFEGLSAPSESDNQFWQAGDLSCSLQTVQANLAEFKSVHYYQGWIPERFDEVADRTFVFVHIDVDLYQPTLDSLKFFYPRMVPGGIIVCDDYGMTTCPGAIQAVDEFFRDKPEKMVGLDAGGGFMIKGIATLD